MNTSLTLHTLRNANGLRADITNLGGRVVSLLVPDKDGQLRDVVLGFENLSDYLLENHRSDFGAAIGRYANRLKNGQITIDSGSYNCEDAVASMLNNGQITIDGHTYQLPQNDGPNCLHGGPDGW